MVQVDPYLSSYGKLLNKENTVRELEKYIITSTNNHLGYEYNTHNKVGLVIITGAHAAEEDIPVFEFPIVFNNVHKDKLIAIDLRKYLKQSKEYPATIKEIVRDTSSVGYLTTSAIIMSDFLSDEFGDYRPVFSSITGAYGVFISSIIDMAIKLDPVEKFNVEIAAIYFANVNLTPDHNIDQYIPAIKARIANMKLSLPVNKNNVDKILDPLKDRVHTIDDLIANIQTILPEEKAELINDKILLNMMSNMWYGPGTNETLVIALENMAIWTSIVYSSLADHTYKRSRMAMLLEKNRRRLNDKDFIRAIENIIKHKTML